MGNKLKSLKTLSSESVFLFCVEKQLLQSVTNEN